MDVQVNFGALGILSHEGCPTRCGKDCDHHANQISMPERKQQSCQLLPAQHKHIYYQVAPRVLLSSGQGPTGLSNGKVLGCTDFPISAVEFNTAGSVWVYIGKCIALITAWSLLAFRPSIGTKDTRDVLALNDDSLSIFHGDEPVAVLFRHCLYAFGCRLGQLLDEPAYRSHTVNLWYFCAKPRTNLAIHEIRPRLAQPCSGVGWCYPRSSHSP